MKTQLLFSFLLFTAISCFAQDIILYSEQGPYPNRDSLLSVFDYMNKADSMSQKYPYTGYKRVDVEYGDSNSVMLNYDDQGALKEFIEFYLDTTAISIKVDLMDSSFHLNIYEWYLGQPSYEEYYYAKENSIEYWYYEVNEFSTLKRVFKVSTEGDTKTEIDTVFKDTVGYSVEKVFKLEDGKWVLKDVKKYDDE